jgi:hypothetical protein
VISLAAAFDPSKFSSHPFNHDSKGCVEYEVDPSSGQVKFIRGDREFFDKMQKIHNWKEDK